MLVRTYGSAVNGVDAYTITIEVDISKGTQYFTVGLPDNAVKESMFRVESAIRVSGMRVPKQRIVVNLAPADIRKEGSAYDLPIAIGILAASEQVASERLKEFFLLGELALNGELKPVRGALATAMQVKKENFRGIILPRENAAEAGVVSGIEVYGCSNLSEVISVLNGAELPLQSISGLATGFQNREEYAGYDFSDVKGQENIKRALEIAAAGGHNIILIGPPGAGKTMLAKRLPSILPTLSLEEAIECTKIYSVAGKLPASRPLITQRPFRSPHHTISDVALVGGGMQPQPGEISLAHNGILFLDELPEFKRSVLEVMRQPLEERSVNISRARFSVSYPCNVTLVASMNPCPCGFYNHPERECSCMPGMVQKYLNRISGPLMDRFDLQIEVTPVPFKELAAEQPAESSSLIRERVEQARALQLNRFDKRPQLHCNAQMSPDMVQRVCSLDTAGKALLKTAMEKLGLSARAYDRILKVARTIADLSGNEKIETPHIAEAIQYRSLDRNNWAG